MNKKPILLDLQNYIDERGLLSVVTEDILGFKFPRVYFVKEVPENTVRGDHAHLYTTQFLACISGECDIMIDDGISKEYFVLKPLGPGLLVPPMHWGEIIYKKENTTLLVFASHKYDPEDYIHSYDEFKERIAN